MSSLDVYLNAPRYSIGTPRSIALLPELVGKTELIKKLNSKGIEHFVESDCPTNLLVVQAITETLSACELPPEAIDAVLIASGNVARTTEDEHLIFSALQSLNITHVAPISVGLSECANLTVALRIARALIGGDGLRNILVLMVDRLEKGAPRFFELDLAVIGEGAASCLITTQPRSPDVFRILGNHHHTNLTLSGRRLDRATLADFARHYVDGFAHTVQKVFAESRRDPREVTMVFTPNLSKFVLGLIAASLNVNRDRLFSDNLRRIGHVQGCDVLINLRDYRKVKECPAGHLMLLVTMGPVSWGVSLLETV